MGLTWTIFKTWLSGNTLTASDLNATFASGVNAFDAAFDETTGHDHDGMNSKKISYSSLNDKPVDKNAYVLTITGGLSTGTDLAPLHHKAFESGTLVEVIAVVKTAPTGANLIIDITVAGTSIWNNGGNRLQIAAGNTTNSTTSINNTAISKGDLVKLDVDQVGSTVTGADLTVYLVYTASL